MPDYIIRFYKKLLSSDGHEHNCLQLIIDVAADTPDQAIESAKQGVIRDKQAPCWIDRDDRFEVEERI